MKNTSYLKDLKIGSMFKEIAERKDVTPKEIADCIRLYQTNPHKIYGLDDFDAEHVVKVSYLLQYNFLNVISEKYLALIPVVENSQDNESCYMELDTKTGQIEIIGDIGKENALKNIDIGKHIRKFAEINGWSGKDVAKLLNCSESTVSNLYDCKSLKIKKFIKISESLNYNFIAEVYLSRMFIIFSRDMFSNCTIIVTSKEVRIESPNDKTFSRVFRRQDDEK